MEEAQHVELVKYNSISLFTFTDGPKANLNGLGTRTKRPQSTSGTRGPTVSTTAQKSPAETNETDAEHLFRPEEVFSII